MSETELHERVRDLRDELKEAKVRITEQGNIIKQLTSPPFIHATVVKIHAVKTPGLSKRERIEKFGTRVRVHPRSSYKRQTESIGTVIGSAQERGWVIVLFDEGSVNSYRTGHEDIDEGACDLELVEESEETPTATIAVENKIFEVPLPKKLSLNPGDTIAVAPESMQIIGVLSKRTNKGEIARFLKMIDDDAAEVEHQSMSRVVFIGSLKTPLEKGDRILLDSSGTIIIGNLGKENERFKFTSETHVSWDDIGGLQKAKEQIIEAVELPHQHPDLFRRFGKRSKKGILLYGPPGCGKTMLGKATATALARIYNGNGSSTGFLYMKGPEVLDKYVGVAEATIREVFERARKHKKTSGYPAVIFVDEADAILGRRGSGISSDVERTIVPTFLTEWDGLEESAALMLLATNRQDMLDPAVMRDGRVDIKIHVDRPDYESAKEIFSLNLKNIPIVKPESREEFAKTASEALFSADYVLYCVDTKNNGTMNFMLHHIVNGAMIVNIIEQATSIALHRCLAKHNSPKSAPEELRKEDLLASVDQTFQQNRTLNHTDELLEFTYDFREDVKDIYKLRQTTK